MTTYIDTHTHLAEEEFDADRQATVERARQAGCEAMLLPAIDLKGLPRLLEVCRQYPDCRPMAGLHPEEVRGDWQCQLDLIRLTLPGPFIAIGEVGLDFYWSRDYEREQLLAFEQQVEWAQELSLPLMIHCRKAQQEMLRILRRHRPKELTGVFHCFTGNAREAAALLAFDGFALGIGGVLTFKKSKLPETLAAAVPLDRIVLETDAPYMAPVPMRGTRNESSFIPHIISRLADCYNVAPETVARTTTETAKRIFRL